MELLSVGSIVVASDFGAIHTGSDSPFMLVLYHRCWSSW